MTAPIAPSTPTSAVSRVLFFAAGIVALGLGIIITLGVAVVGALAIAVVAFFKRRRGRRLTRRGAWFASAVGTASVLAVVIGIAVLTDDTATKPMTSTERAEQRTKATEGMPEWLKNMNPNAQRQSAAVDSMASQLLENRAVVIWSGLMGAVIASAILGTIAGSFAWGGVMLLYRGIQGEWMPSATAAPDGL